MKLVSSATGRQVDPGTILHMQSGPTAGQTWRFERIAERRDGEHHIRVSRTGGKLGRVQREYHPSIFGCAVTVDIRWYVDHVRLARALRAAVAQTTVLTVAGIVAWIVAEVGNWSGVLSLFGIHTQ
ncbi:hypothetical protein ACFVYG_08700 [Streptomyces sp. NPDC058256]|uniref:hypothetical protein n=1 Tax=Streptomyces sp. NPDC058256 TaxID=3346408 RepID=UPI0036E325B7